VRRRVPAKGVPSCTDTKGGKGKGEAGLLINLNRRPFHTEKEKKSTKKEFTTKVPGGQGARGGREGGRKKKGGKNSSFQGSRPTRDLILQAKKREGLRRLKRQAGFRAFRSSTNGKREEGGKRGKSCQSSFEKKKKKKERSRGRGKKKEKKMKGENNQLRQVMIEFLRPPLEKGKNCPFFKMKRRNGKRIETKGRRRGGLDRRLTARKGNGPTPGITHQSEICKPSGERGKKKDGNICCKKKNR